MSVSVEAVPTNKTSVKEMTIMLLAAFIAAQLNLFGSLTAIFIPFAFPTRNQAGFNLLSQNLGLGITFFILTFLLLLASFLAISLYPERRPRQMNAGFVGAAVWAIGLITLYSVRVGGMRALLIAEVGIGIAITLSLLVSGRIKAWPDLVGMTLGLLIGAGLHNTNLYAQSSLDFSPIWLSAVLFLELFSRRTGWRAALLGAIIWIGLIALSVLTASFVHHTFSF